MIKLRENTDRLSDNLVFSPSMCLFPWRPLYVSHRPHYP